MEKPVEGQCPVCENTFEYIHRPQGGGKRRIYCSAKCRSLDWGRGNGGKRQASVLKYDNKPESKQKKRERSRKATLARYGWTDEDFMQQLWMQNGKCLGCLDIINHETARIDHCHRAGHVRGLLCDRCNWALGHVRDSVSTLTRLAAYLG